MGNVFRKNRKDIKIVNVITKSDLLKYPHLNLRGEIIVKKYIDSYIPEIDLRFKNYFPATVRVWPKDFSSMCSAESDICFSEVIIRNQFSVILFICFFNYYMQMH